MSRSKVSKTISKDVLVASGRRCALCFGLKQDSGTKRGQIAHIDRDPQNNEFENLAYLCLDCHDEYDSEPSQSRRYTSEELLHYRQKLYEHVRRISSVKPPGSILHHSDESTMIEYPNEFEIYTLINSESVSGYQFLAVDEERIYCLLISSNNIVVERTNWESNQWLNSDYSRTGRTINFNLSKISDSISDTFHEIDFSLIYHFEDMYSESLTFVFNEKEKYYELDYFFKNDKLFRGDRGIPLAKEDGERKCIINTKDAITSILKLLFPKPAKPAPKSLSL